MNMPVFFATIAFGLVVLAALCAQGGLGMAFFAPHLSLIAVFVGIAATRAYLKSRMTAALAHV